VNKVNVVNVGERYKRVTFTTYPDESKGAVNVVNVVRGFFYRRARGVPNGFEVSLAHEVHAEMNLMNLYELAKPQVHIQPS
jgi:hypothetical protein